MKNKYINIQQFPELLLMAVMGSAIPIPYQGLVTPEYILQHALGSEVAEGEHYSDKFGPLPKIDIEQVFKSLFEAFVPMRRLRNHYPDAGNATRPDIETMFAEKHAANAPLTLYDACVIMANDIGINGAAFNGYMHAGTSS